MRKRINRRSRSCLGCGKLIIRNFEENKNIQPAINSSNNNKETYKMITGILMIILSVCLVVAGVESYEDYAVLTFTIPEILGLIAGILNVCSRKNHNLLKPAGILFFVGAGVNFLGIMDISIYSILAIIFGIFNIIYYKNNNKSFL